MPASEATDQTFETAVLDRSTQTTVVVDLWATWCGPCQTLGPLLEKVVDEADGVELVKVDVDRSPGVAQAFQVQSIPAVYALRDRQVIDGFVGALPEPALREWLSRLSQPPSEAEQLLGAGDEASLRKALELEPANERIVLALAALLASEPTDDTRRQEALALLAKVADSTEARHIAAQARLGSEAAADDAGVDVEDRLDGLLDKVKSDDAARQEFLDVLEVLGPDDPRTARYRRALTARLF